MTAAAELLEIADLHVTVGRGQDATELVRGVSFTLDAGEMVGLVGESGCGKTMTAMSIVQLLPAEVRITAGRISFCGEDLVGALPALLREIRGKGIGVVFQDPMTALNPLHNVGKQVSEPLKLHRLAKRRERVRRAIDLLKEVGMPQSDQRLRARPFEFSGGMRQRVLIAEALSCRPKFLIADEPTTGLDVTIQVQILALLDRLREELRMGVLLISHDLTMIGQVCERILVMYAGRIVETGPTAEVLRDPRHPYSLALAGCVPGLSTVPGERLPALAGAPPAMTDFGPGCSLVPRCAYAEDICALADPELMEVGAGHCSACWVAQRQGSLEVHRDHR